MRGTPDSSKRPPCVAASSASTAASGRIAVPALPRNSVASCTRSRPPRPSMRSAPALGCCTVQPSARKASSMTRVSSESSSSCTSVLPSASAASSSTRLEMLFEPGSRTVPEAPRSGGRSRNGMSNIARPVDARRLSAPAAPAACPSATGAGLRWPRAAVPAAPAPLPASITCSSASSDWRKRCDCFSTSSRLAMQDVAPHRRVAGGDAREVAKARAGQRQQVAPGRLAEHAAEVGEGQQVRQVADGGKGAVVVLGRHLQHLRADAPTRRRWPSAPAPASVCGSGVRMTWRPL